MRKAGIAWVARVKFVALNVAVKKNNVLLIRIDWVGNKLGVVFKNRIVPTWHTYFWDHLEVLVRCRNREYILFLNKLCLGVDEDDESSIKNFIYQRQKFVASAIIIVVALKMQ